MNVRLRLIQLLYLFKDKLEGKIYDNDGNILCKVNKGYKIIEDNKFGLVYIMIQIYTKI